jgi:hypothetical protein
VTSGTCCTSLLTVGGPAYCSPATTLPFSDSAVSFVNVPYLVHEVLLLSPSSSYLLINCYHNLCTVNYTSIHVVAKNNKFLLVHEKLCFVTQWPPASEIDMLLITNFLELRVVAGRSRTRAGRPHAGYGRPMLIHTYNAVPLPRPSRGLVRSFSKRHIRGMAGERLVCVNQTRPDCVNQWERKSKPLVERHGMCESALKRSSTKFCIYTLLPPDGGQQASPKHVEV